MLTNAKEYLKQYENADIAIKKKQQKVDELEAMADAVKSVTDCDGMPHGTNIGHPTEQRAIDLTDAKMELADIILKNTSLKEEVFMKIMKVDGIEGEVLYERYIHYWQTWEQIGFAIGYSDRHAKRIHGKALNIFRKKYDLS